MEVELEEETAAPRYSCTVCVPTWLAELVEVRPWCLTTTGPASSS